LLAESVLLGAIGGAAGIAFAWPLHLALPKLLPPDFPRLDDLGFGAVVILFAAGLSLVASVAFGVFPAVRLRRLDLVESLGEDGTVLAGAGGRSRTGRARAAIMASQVAIACVLLIAASLLGRSFLALVSADRGYDPSGVLTARLSLPASMYTPERRYTIVRDLLDRLAAAPGVTHGAFTSELPLTAGGSTSAFTLRHAGRTMTAQASPRIVSAHAFPALGMRVSSGRGFADSDTDGSIPVAVVNRAFARRYLDDDALGARLPMAAGYQQREMEATVVGVVDDVRYANGADTAQPEIYYVFRQFEGRLVVPTVTLLIRTTGDPVRFAGNVRAAVREVDRMLVAEAVMSMEDRLLGGLARPRLYTVVLGGFASFALIVAAVGLFSVLSQTVADRSREIAVRTALGARPSDIVRFILRQGFVMTVAGLLAGLAAAAALGRSMSSLLYGVTAHDAPTYILVPLTVLLIAAIACLVPALRAARLDPARVLRA
jgi:predicted permease